MEEKSSSLDRERLRRWVANWRIVNDAQDALIKAAPPADPAACLAIALSMIDVAMQISRRHAPVAQHHEDDSVHQTWIRLRAAYGR
jgi:hypothetical protein